MALVWTPTASPAIQNLAYSNWIATFTAASIGTASSDRIVVVGVMSENHNNSTIQSVTIAGGAATKIGSDTQEYLSAWYRPVASGTTADIVVTGVTNLGLSLVGIQVGILTGAAATPGVPTYHQHDAVADPQEVTGTVPSAGVGIVYVMTASPSASTAPVWSAATGDSYAHSEAGNTMQAIMAHTSTAGSQTPSMSGGYDYDGTSMMFIPWSVGSTGNTYTENVSDSGGLLDELDRACTYYRLIGKA